MGDQDWVGTFLENTRPSVPHQIGRRDPANSKAWCDEHHRLEGKRESDLVKMLKQLKEDGHLKKLPYVKLKAINI